MLRFCKSVFHDALLYVLRIAIFILTHSYIENTTPETLKKMNSQFKFEDPHWNLRNSFAKHVHETWGISGRECFLGCKWCLTTVQERQIFWLKLQWEHYFPYNFLENNQQNMIQLSSTAQLSQAMKYKQRCNDDKQSKM